MYTEVKELANLVARFLFPKFSRMKVCLFTEHYANLLLVRFSDNWDISDPTHGEKFRTFILRNGKELERDLDCSSTVMLVRKDLLLRMIPDGLSVRIGPGYVTYRVSESSPSVNVWNGPVNADENYSPIPEFVLKWKASNMGTVDATNMGIGLRGGAVYGQSSVDGGSKLDVHDYVTLRLTVRSTVGYLDSNLPSSPYNMKFEYTGKEDETIKVGEFALTRFGSNKKRPDYDLIQRIQRQAQPEAMMMFGHEGAPPPPPPFANAWPPAPMQFHSRGSSHAAYPPAPDTYRPFNMVNDGRYSGPQHTSFGWGGGIPNAQDETSLVPFFQDLAITGGFNGTFSGSHLMQNTYMGGPHDVQEFSPKKKY